MGLFGRKQDRSAVDVTLLEGHHQIAVVGESHYQDALWRQAGAARGSEVRCGSIAILSPEPDNQFDPNAIAVILPTGKIGYLSRDDATLYLPGLRALMALHRTPIAVRCQIIGGGFNGTHAKALGVWLEYDPADFGVAVEAPRSGVRTGEAASGARSWQAGLPDDSVKRIAFLRAALANESAPIDRHFIFAILEETLYKCRNVFPSALVDYEASAIAHDAEMGRIIPALIAEFDGVPMLVTYKQMTILKTKAKDDREALRWAKRGLELYGDRCISPDGAGDLRARVAKLEAKRGGSVAAEPPAALPQTSLVAARSSGWLPDPSGRFQHRYWNGERWTEHVATDGVSSTDPPVASA